MAVLTGDTNVLANRQSGKRHRLLERSHQPAAGYLMGSSTGNILVPPQNTASGWFMYTGNNVEQGCFAGSVWTDDTDDFVGLDRNIDSGQRDNAAKFLTKSGDFQVCHGLGSLLKSPLR